MGVVLLLLAVLVLLAVNVTLTAILFVRVVGKPEPGERSHPAAEREEQTRENRIDEGFENIMRFEVGGKTGFEQEGTAWR